MQMPITLTSEIVRYTNDLDQKYSNVLPYSTGYMGAKQLLHLRRVVITHLGSLMLIFYIFLGVGSVPTTVDSQDLPTKWF